MADDEEISKAVASNVVTGKLSNCRVVINRIIRDHESKVDAESLKSASEKIGRIINRIPRAQSIDEVRGFEGQGAAEYFNIFNHLIISQKEDFIFSERSRRPPLDEVNALLSFIYTLLSHDVRSAIETVGLDSQVGFLHRDRSGRHSLALDLMEEFRPAIADRLVLSLINRKQVGKKNFSKASSGAVTIDDTARKTVLTEFQNRKQDTISHPYIDETVPIGLLFFIQASAMARYIRGDIDGYPPFFWK
jgi:CRISPR-associated protein Cas1